MSAAVDSSPRSRFVYRTSALLLLVVMGLWLFRVQDAYQAALPLAAILLAAVSPLPFRRWSAIDWLVTLLTVFDVASCFYSACPVPALQQASFSVCCLTAYLVARRLWADPDTAKLLFYGSYVPSVLAVGVAVCSFFVFRSSVLEAGFADTYAFRFLFRPLGYITNQWAEVLLLLLGWLCLARRHTSVLVFLTAAALCLSFSRGAYLALGAFVLAWLAGMRPWRKALRVPLLCLSAAVCIGVCFPQETPNHPADERHRVATTKHPSTHGSDPGRMGSLQAKSLSTVRTGQRQLFTRHRPGTKPRQHTDLYQYRPEPSHPAVGSIPQKPVHHASARRTCVDRRTVAGRSLWHEIH